MRNISIVLTAILAFLGLCGVAPAAELYVPADHSTIQAAIDASSNGDVIIVADDTYTGLENKNLDFGGRAITLMSENGPDACIIDCEGSGRGFIFQSGEDENSVVDGFTLKNGDGLSFTSGDKRGGGILCVGSNPTIINCTIKKNRGSDGGGMDNHHSNPKVINCIFMENVAQEGSCDGDGGGMNNVHSSPEVTNCLFVNNVGGRGCGSGGAMRNEYSGSSPIVTNCTFVGNKSSYGGAAEASNASPTFINCIFWGNQGNSSRGDEIRNASGSTATFTHCDIEGGWNGSKVVNSGSVVIDGGGNINADPNFVNATNPDIYARDYHLSEGSPCIDAGTDGGVDFDLDGDPRPYDYPDVDNNGELPDFDIGAYEASLYRWAICNIHKTLLEKTKALEAIDAALEKEQIAYDTLEQMLESADYGDLKKGDIVKAKQKIYSAIQHQEQAKHQLEKSIEKLDDALESLGY